MLPGGHLATALALGSVAHVTTGSAEAAAGCFAGGFLTDLDQCLDDLVFEKQWRHPSPVSFLRYYLLVGSRFGRFEPALNLFYNRERSMSATWFPKACLSQGLRARLHGPASEGF
jgi:hypothetical protein